ncbi:MAG: hypothetical protein N3J91_15735 [Verrucomicrobiae bacterium]|nr:hypothetical protein [Verrucomicrobiae bacterium]
MNVKLPFSSVRSRRPWYLRFLMGLAFALTAIIGLILLVAAFEGIRGTSKWRKLKTELEARGENFNLNALQPLPVPDEKNFATTPLIASLFSTNGQSPAPAPQTWPKAALEDWDHDKSGNGPGRKRNDLRTPLKLWSDYYRGHAKFPQAPSNASPAEVVRTALAQYDPQINELLQAMQERPLCRYPLDYQQGIALWLPHLANYKGLVLVIQLRALADLHLGQTDKAFQELRLGCFLNDTLTQDPILICLLVHIANDRMLQEAVREGLALHLWNDQQLTWWVDYYAKRPYLETYQTSMRGERNFAVLTIEQLCRGQIREVLGEETSPTGTSILRAMPRGFFYHNLYNLVKIHHEYTIPAADPKSRQVDKDLVLNFDHAIKQTGYFPYNIFSRLLLPAVGKSVLHTARWQTQGDALLIACAAERYRLARGHWPATLGELVPAYLPFEPRNVLDGSPFIYKIVAPDSLLIYTPGWDEKDDGGQFDSRLDVGDWGIQISPVDEATLR